MHLGIWDSLWIKALEDLRGGGRGMEPEGRTQRGGLEC